MYTIQFHPSIHTSILCCINGANFIRRVGIKHEGKRLYTPSSIDTRCVREEVIAALAARARPHHHPRRHPQASQPRQIAAKTHAQQTQQPRASAHRGELHSLGTIRDDDLHCRGSRGSTKQTHGPSPCQHFLPSELPQQRWSCKCVCG